jgi:hypothetical protein
MPRKRIRRVESRPALAGVPRWLRLALVLASAGLAWACAASLHGSQAAATASARGGWWWFTDDAFRAPSPEERDWLYDVAIATRQRRGGPDDPVVKIERPSGPRISCPFDVSIRFQPGLDPKDHAREVPVDLKSVKVMAEKLTGIIRPTIDLTPDMEFSDSGFSKVGVRAPSGKYRVSIAFKDQLGRTASTQAEFSIEN